MTSKKRKIPEETTEAIPNPRRGWYRIFPVTLGKKMDFAMTETSLAPGDTLVLLEILIPGEEVTEQDVQELCDTISFFIQKKRDLILRFSYDFEGKGREKDPSSLSVVERHMRQILPALTVFANHIFILQGIFLGSWGEMHSSRYLTGENIQKLEKIVKNEMPQKIYRSVRKPVHWRMICGEETGVLFEQEKIGLYNDGMFGSVTDLGTFAEPAHMVPGEEREYAWEEAWPPEREQKMIVECAKYAPQGGEVIYGLQLPAEIILSRLRAEGITYLNRDYDKRELERWKQMDCGRDGVWRGHSLYEYVEAHLGYRFVLRGAAVHRRFRRSILTIEIENTGFAAPYEEIFLTLEETVAETKAGKLRTEEPSVVWKQSVRWIEPRKSAAFKVAVEQKETGKKWKIRLRDAKGNPIRLANEGAAEGISLSVF